MVICSPESEANLFSLLTFWWVSPLLVQGYKKPLREDGPPIFAEELVFCLLSCFQTSGISTKKIHRATAHQPLSESGDASHERRIQVYLLHFSALLASRSQPQRFSKLRKTFLALSGLLSCQ